MTYILAVANQKGGTAKTSTAVSLGGALAARGRKVLLIDLDPQQSLAHSLKAPVLNPGLANVLLGEAKLTEVIQPDIHGMTVLTGANLAYAENRLASEPGAEMLLRLALESADGSYDYSLLDCGPSLTLLTIMALVASRAVLIPVQTEFLALKQLPAMLSTVEKVRIRLNDQLEVLGLIPCLYDRRTAHQQEVLTQIRAEGERRKLRVFSPVPRSTRMSETSVAGEPIFTYASESPAAKAYLELAKEIDK